MPHTLVRRLRGFLARHPDRLLPPDIPQSSDPGDADPRDPDSFKTIAREAHRQQEIAVGNEPDHVRTLQITSAQATQSVRVGTDGFPFAHGVGINARVITNNRVQHGHIDYVFHPSEPGWGLDVPLVSIEQVQSVLSSNGSSISSISNEHIADTFPTSTSLACSNGSDITETGDELSDMAPLEHPEDRSALVLQPASSRNQGVQTDDTLQHATVDPRIIAGIKEKVLQPLPRSIAELLAMVDTLKTQPLASSDQAWVDLDTPNPNCQRCYLQQAHLIETCPSSSLNKVRIYTSLTNAFEVPEPSTDRESLGLIRPGTPYPHKVEFKPYLQSNFPPPPVVEYTTHLAATSDNQPEFESTDSVQATYTTNLTEEPESYSDGLPTPISAPHASYRTGSRKDYPVLRPFTAPPIIVSSPSPDSPRQSPRFTQFLDEQLLDALYESSHRFFNSDTKYPEISTAGAAAYYSEVDASGIQVLRLPAIDEVVQTMSDTWSYRPFSTQNPFSLPACNEFFQQLYKAWGYLPTIIDRHTFLLQNKLASEFSGLDPTHDMDSEYRFQHPKRYLKSLFTASRGPYKPLVELQHYPERRQSTSLALPTRPYPEKHFGFPFNFQDNARYVAPFAAYLDETIWSQIWTVMRAISPVGGVRYPDISDTSNSTYHVETLDDGTEELRIPSIDNLVETLAKHWGYKLYSQRTQIALPYTESFFRDLYHTWDYLPRMVSRIQYTAHLDHAMDTLTPEAPEIPTAPNAMSTESVGLRHLTPLELLDVLVLAGPDRGPFTAPLITSMHPDIPLTGAVVLGIPNEVHSRRLAPPAYICENSESKTHVRNPDYDSYIDELVFDNIWKVRRSIGPPDMSMPNIYDPTNMAFYLDIAPNRGSLLRIPGVDAIVHALYDRFGYSFLADDNTFHLPASEAWVRSLFIHWDYLPELIDRDSYVRLHEPQTSDFGNPDSPFDSPTHMLLYPPTPASNSTDSGSLTLGPASFKESGKDMKTSDDEFEYALKQYTRNYDSISPVDMSTVSTPDSLPDLISVHSDDDLAKWMHEDGPNHVEYHRSLPYTRAWINKMLVTRDRWSSSSLDSTSARSCDSEIPPYDSELAYDAYESSTAYQVVPQEPLFVATVLVKAKDSMNVTDPSAPPTPAPVTEDEVPAFQHPPRRDSEDDGAAGGSTTEAAALQSPRENTTSAPRSPIEIEMTPISTSLIYTESAVPKLASPPIHTRFPRPFRSSPLSAPPRVMFKSTPSPTPSITTTEPLSDDDDAMSLENSPVKGSTLNARFLSDLCVNPPEYWSTKTTRASSPDHALPATSEFDPAPSPTVQSPVPSAEIPVISEITAEIESLTARLKAIAQTHAASEPSESRLPAPRGRVRFRTETTTTRRRGRSRPRKPRTTNNAAASTSSFRTNNNLNTELYWEGRMDEIQQHRLETQQTIARLAKQFSRKGIQSPDPRNSRFHPITFGSYSPRPIPSSFQKKPASSVMRPDFYDSKTITLSALPSTIFSLYGSTEMQQFAQSLVRDISILSRKYNLPYRVTTMPEPDCDGWIRLYIDLPNTTPGHHRMVQDILRKFRSFHSNPRHLDFHILLTVNSTPPPRPVPSRRERRLLARTRQQERARKYSQNHQ
ncbi:hypothetical protein DFH06DRAFT_1473364 [Mycena polygramma]|nr:hypothetical protein DFH06DRAFT_1473364 [Mycena polygramma]